MTLRFIKIIILFYASLFAGLVGFNNIVDFDSNYIFIQHVLSMDSVFPNTTLMGRGITSASAHRFIYICIIIAECSSAVIGFVGCYKLLYYIKQPSPIFNSAKQLGLIALSIMLSIWFAGFSIVASEWFLMWQSSNWNAKSSAMHISILLSVFLLIYTQED